jgi:hypothetical protein
MMANPVASPVPARLNRRAAERRHSIASLVEALTRGLVAGREPGQLRERADAKTHEELANRPRPIFRAPCHCRSHRYSGSLLRSSR